MRCMTVDEKCTTSQWRHTYNIYVYGNTESIWKFFCMLSTTCECQPLLGKKFDRSKCRKKLSKLLKLNKYIIYNYFTQIYRVQMIMLKFFVCVSRCWLPFHKRNCSPLERIVKKIQSLFHTNRQVVLQQIKRWLERNRKHRRINIFVLYWYTWYVNLLIKYIIWSSIHSIDWLLLYFSGRKPNFSSSSSCCFFFFRFCFRFLKKWKKFSSYIMQAWQQCFFLFLFLFFQKRIN